MITSVILGAALSSGLVFECNADTANLTVFAPSQEATAGYRGNVLTLYEVSGDGEIVPANKRIQQVIDILPDSLLVQMMAPDFNVELEITEYNAAAATSMIRITGALPEGQSETINGTCTVTQREEADAP